MWHSYQALQNTICSPVIQAGDSGDRGVQLLAVQLLGLTAEASVMNCGKLAALGAGGSLLALANTALERPADRQLRWDLSRQGISQNKNTTQKATAVVLFTNCKGAAFDEGPKLLP